MPFMLLPFMIPTPGPHGQVIRSSK